MRAMVLGFLACAALVAGALGLRSYDPRPAIGIAVICPSEPTLLAVSDKQRPMKQFTMYPEVGDPREFYRTRWVPSDCTFLMRKSETYPEVAALLADIDASQYGLGVRVAGFYNPNYDWAAMTARQRRATSSQLFWSDYHFFRDVDASYTISIDEHVALDEDDLGVIEWDLTFFDFASDPFYDQLLGSRGFEKDGVALQRVGAITGGKFDQQQIYLALLALEFLPERER